VEDEDWTTSRVEGCRCPGTRLQELLGQVEILRSVRRRAIMSLGVCRLKVDSPDNHPLQQGELLAEMYGGRSRELLRANKTIDKFRQCYYWLHLKGDFEG
jgi:hypothetical protein